jgi:uracil-DNA glycosylase
VSDRDVVLHDLAERARFYASLTEIGISLDRPGPAGITGDDSVQLRGRSVSPSGAGEAAPDGRASGAVALTAIRDFIGDCQRCKLAGGRKTIVFGQGNPDAALMFVGEAPGAEEDEKGLAFVGRAGQLLTDIIEKGLKMPRSEVFIANVIKCRPPGNRNPELDEIASCQPFLEQQIRAIRPKVIIGLGKFAGQWLLKTAEPISRIRGRLGHWEGIMVIPTYHPAFLLRNPAAKKDVWEDIKVVRGLLAGD